MHGILLLDKPSGPSSNQALGRIKRLFGVAKAGHTGTLDPLATGMLPCCLGEATKVAGYVIGARKAYQARIRLGIATDTGDAEGEVLAEGVVPEFDDAALASLLARHTGRIRQRPPAYSAIKRGGVPLYRLARRGEAVEAPEREVLIDRIDVLARGAGEFEILVVCGSGTYIRSLAVDLGAALGCPAHLAALRRLWVEPFEHEPMVGFDAVERAAAAGPAALAALLLPMERALVALPRVELPPELAFRLRQGQSVPVPGATPGGLAQVSSCGRFLGVGEVLADGRLKPRRLLAA